MGAADLPFLLLLPALLVASAMASGSETALFGVTHAERGRLSARHPAAARALAALLARPRRLLITVLILNTAINVTYFVVVSVLTMRADSAAWAAGISLGSLMAIVLLGEILAKLMAAAHRETVLVVIAGPARLITAAMGCIAGPVERLLVQPATRLLSSSAGQASGVSADELGALLSHAMLTGAIDQDEQRLLSEVIRLGEARVREAMTPRVDVQWLDSTGDVAEQAAELAAGGLHRVPVAAGSIDNGVDGWLDLRRYLLDPGPIEGTLSPAVVTPDRARLDQALGAMQRRGAHAAVCVNELGEVAGVIGLTDIIDELLGPPPATDGAEEDGVRLVGLNTWSAPARLPVRDWAELFGADARRLASRVSTVGGLLLAQIGRMPTAGDQATLGRLRLTAEEVEGRAIRRVLVELVSDEEAER